MNSKRIEIKTLILLATRVLKDDTVQHYDETSHICFSLLFLYCLRHDLFVCSDIHFSYECTELEHLDSITNIHLSLSLGMRPGFDVPKLELVVRFLKHGHLRLKNL